MGSNTAQNMCRRTKEQRGGERERGGGDGYKCAQPFLPHSRKQTSLAVLRCAVLPKVDVDFISEKYLQIDKRCLVDDSSRRTMSNDTRSSLPKEDHSGGVERDHCRQISPQPAAASSETIISCQLRIGDALAVTSSEESVRTQRYEELRPPHYTSS
ncbi:hypothetical protein QR680_012197 [Steinernema hermaphroditum]|uniref:Uncharacterized protein n=1 Tax=Steinernema hermaphroditum TaxID=289476 RepID=A0AA39I199_9BILA|nr:hypothetical protein QR680_012197 [Steinernema hermaphroditum]